jgi:hypothetical protein
MDLRTVETAAFEKSPEQARLAHLEGSWEGTAKTFLDPAQPPEVEAWRGTMALVLGGRFLRFEYASRAMGKPIAGEMIVAYESGDRRWRTAWIDSFHTSPAILASEGEPGQSAAIRVRGSYFAGEGHPHWGWITEIDDARASEGALRIVMKNVTPDGEEMPGLEIELARATAR